MIKYKIGEPKEPSMSFDEDFPYDPKAKATSGDYVSYAYWTVKLKGATLLRKDLTDATRAYKHYLSGSGATLGINYYKAYNEDPIIKKYVNKEIYSAQKAAQKLCKGRTNYSITGGIRRVPNGTNENWQKTIGAHYIWGSGNVSFNKKTKNFKMKITIHMKDRYNFNKGMSDLRTGASDDVNGRFATLGWAKSFYTTGSLGQTVSWRKGRIKKTTKISFVPGR